MAGKFGRIFIKVFRVKAIPMEIEVYNAANIQIEHIFSKNR